jgi:hypothetical protein
MSKNDVSDREKDDDQCVEGAIALAMWTAED